MKVLHQGGFQCGVDVEFEVAVLIDTVFNLVGERFKHVLGFLEVEDLSVIKHELVLEVLVLGLHLGRDSMRDSLESHIGSALLLTSFELELLLLWGWNFSFLLFSSRRSISGSISLLFLLGGGGRLGSTVLNRDLLLLGPMFSHLDALKLWDLVDVVLDADGEFGEAAWHFSVSSLAPTDVILSDSLGKTSHEGRSG